MRSAVFGKTAVLSDAYGVCQQNVKNGVSPAQQTSRKVCSVCSPFACTLFARSMQVSMPGDQNSTCTVSQECVPRKDICSKRLCVGAGRSAAVT